MLLLAFLCRIYDACLLCEHPGRRQTSAVPGEGTKLGHKGNGATQGDSQNGIKV